MIAAVKYVDVTTHVRTQELPLTASHHIFFSSGLSQMRSSDCNTAYFLPTTICCNDTQRIMINCLYTEPTLFLSFNYYRE